MSNGGDSISEVTFRYSCFFFDCEANAMNKSWKDTKVVGFQVAKTPAASHSQTKKLGGSLENKVIHLRKVCTTAD